MKKQILAYVSLILLVLALLPRVTLLLKEQSFWWDEAVYLAMADTFLGNNYFFEYFRAPLFPLMLSGFGFLFGLNVFTGKILSLIISSLTAVIIYQMLKKIFDERTAVFSSLAYIVNFESIRYAVRGLTESAVVLFLMISLFSFIAYFLYKKSKNYFYLCALSTSLAVMTRHTAWYVLPVYFLFLLMRRGLIKDIKIKDAFVAALIFVLPLLPWLIFNYVKFGNPFWPQLVNAEMATPAPFYFYIPGLFGFMGIFSIFVIIRLLKFDEISKLNLMLISFFVIFASFIPHKEVRFLIAVLPSVVLLSGSGIALVFNRKNDKKIKTVFFIFILGFTLTFLTLSVSKETVMYKCADYIKTMPDEKMITTMTPYFSFFLRRPFEQLSWDIHENCTELQNSQYNYIIYYSMGWYKPLAQEFIDKNKACIDLIYNYTEYDSCLVYNIRR